MAPTGRPINLTRALLRYALHDGGPDWADALPLLTAVMRSVIRRRGRAALYEQVHQDLEVNPSRTLRALMTQALDRTADTAAALRLVHEVMKGNERPRLAATIMRETHREVLGAVFRALREEDRARAAWMPAAKRQMAFRWPPRRGPAPDLRSRG